MCIHINKLALMWLTLHIYASYPVYVGDGYPKLVFVQWLLYKNGFREKAKGVTENPHGRLSASLEGVQEEDKTRFE